MSGRTMRARAPVNYNDKDSMEPAWLKKMQTTASSTPPKMREKTASSKSTNASNSAEKENTTAKQMNKLKEPKSGKLQTTAKTKSKEASAKVDKSKKVDKKEKKQATAARGRNAGVTVVPIADRKGKSSKPNNASKDSQPSSSLGTLPKAPSQPRQVPGLPGVVQKGAVQPSKSRPAATKRKIPANEITPPEKIKPIPTTTIPSAEPSPKRQRIQHQPYDIPARAPSQQEDRPRHQSSITLPPSPKAAFSFSPLHISDTTSAPLEEMRANFASLAELCTQLQEENELLKKARIQEDVEALIAQQNARVTEHGRKASELAAHWQEEAERLAKEVEELRGTAIHEEMRMLRTQIATLQQAIIDRDITDAERAKAIVELQQRNKFLERHARIPITSEKCVGTDPVTVVSAAVHLPQARAMIPEGADGSSLYIPGDHHHNNNVYQQRHGVVDASFSLAHQQTVAHMNNQHRGGSASGGHRNDDGSDMMMASAGQYRPTAESVQQHRVTAHHNRAVQPVAGPLVGVDGVPRQIQFYSTTTTTAAAAAAAGNNNANNNNATTNNNYSTMGMIKDATTQIQQDRGGLSIVHEENENGEEEEQQQQNDAHMTTAMNNNNNMDVSVQYENPLASDSAPLPREAALELIADMVATPLAHGQFMYTHKKTGFKCIIGRLPAAEIELEVDTKYKPISFGLAEQVIREAVGGIFVNEFSFKSSSKAAMFSGLANALAKVVV